MYKCTQTYTHAFFQSKEKVRMNHMYDLMFYERYFNKKGNIKKDIIESCASRHLCTVDMLASFIFLCFLPSFVNYFKI